MKPNLVELQVHRHHTTSLRTGGSRRCPVCPDTELVLTQRQGVEIDCCPKCRGVWLDRGELDKLIEDSTPGSAEASKPRKSWFTELFN